MPTLARFHWNMATKGFSIASITTSMAILQRQQGGLAIHHQIHHPAPAPAPAPAPGFHALAFPLYFQPPRRPLVSTFRLLASMGESSAPQIEQIAKHKQVQQEPVKARASSIEIADYSFEGISIGGHETCVIVPKLKVAFDIGRCPQRAISQDYLFISHSHMDHIGGIAMYVATRGLYKMKPPKIIVPKCIKEMVEKLFEVYRQLDGSLLAYELIALDIGETFDMGKGYVAKAFKTYHVIPSQGYVLYSVRNKLKEEYLGLPGNEIKRLKENGVEITYKVTVPEIAFTGDTMADFIVDDNNADVLKAKILIMEATFVDDSMSVEHAREYGHTHLSEVAALSDRFQNQGILFIHFSARYRTEEVQTAIKNLPKALQERSYALLEGF